MIPAKDLSKNRYVRQLVDELAEWGHKAIIRAYQKKDWHNRTYNLHDSYASAVYVEGKLQQRTIRFVGEEMHSHDTEFHEAGQYSVRRHDLLDPDRQGDRYGDGDTLYTNGRDEAISFLRQYVPNTSGVQLVVIAAMFYADILERGGGNLKRKYHVIADANSTLEQLARSLGGDVRPISATFTQYFKTSRV